MKRILTLVFGAATLSTLAIGGIAVASGPHGPPGIEARVIQFVHSLDLSDTQKQTFQTAKTELLSDTPDSAMLHQLIDDRAVEMQQRAHDRLDTALEVAAILEPDQRGQIADKLEELKTRMEDRRSRIGAGGGPRGDLPRFGE